MTSEQQSEQGRTAATVDPRKTATFNLSSSVIDQLRRRCKLIGMSQSFVVETCVKAFLGDQFTIVNGQVAVNN